MQSAQHVSAVDTSRRRGHNSMSVWQIQDVNDYTTACQCSRHRSTRTQRYLVCVVIIKAVVVQFLLTHLAVGTSRVHFKPKCRQHSAIDILTVARIRTDRHGQSDMGSRTDVWLG